MTFSGSSIFDINLFTLDRTTRKNRSTGFPCARNCIEERWAVAGLSPGNGTKATADESKADDRIKVRSVMLCIGQRYLLLEVVR